LSERTYLNKARGDFPFCPGCGHGQILKALDKAMVDLKFKPNKTIIVTDIGCVGLSDLYFNTSGFHGLHGRSITYATGLKLADRSLNVIVLIGDGGCGIGGAHLLNAARRNVDITVLVFNNFNYGMTGGEHSITTPLGAVTNTTPRGNHESPLDLCATLAPSKPGYLARASALDRDLTDVIKQGLSAKGFSLVDIWEMCMAYYGPKNKLTKKGLDRMMKDLKMKKGIHYLGSRPEYTGKSEKGGRVPKALWMKKKYKGKLGHKVGILIAGGAGQKVASSATNLGRAAIISGMYATQKDDHPITVMTGHSNSEVILSPDPIEYTGIEVPDYAILLSDDGVKRALEVLCSMGPDCTIIADEDIEVPPTDAGVIRLPLKKESKKIDKLTLASFAFGALLKVADPFPLEALVNAIEFGQKADISKRNMKAAKAGFKLAEKMGL
jgi:pyruvate/2-oxoacid:ferredoxin oxidoreductase beta subunit/Pyruvate/2-oxoacid:ferredoxin oxidoreductase gamma subunit